MMPCNAGCQSQTNSSRGWSGGEKGCLCLAFANSGRAGLDGHGSGSIPWVDVDVDVDKLPTSILRVLRPIHPMPCHPIPCLACLQQSILRANEVSDITSAAGPGPSDTSPVSC